MGVYVRACARSADEHFEAAYRFLGHHRVVQTVESTEHGGITGSGTAAHDCAQGREGIVAESTSSLKPRSS